VDFGDVLVGQTGYQGVLVKNTGGAGLALYSVYRDNGGPTITASRPPFWTEPGQADAVAVRFNDRVAGSD
jgi:hypothetical protein